MYKHINATCKVHNYGIFMNEFTTKLVKDFKATTFPSCNLLNRICVTT